MRIDGGSDGSGQAVPDPKADDFARHAAFFTTADVCMPQFVDMVVRKYSFERRSDRMEIGGTRFCKIDIRQDFAYHGSKRGPTQNDTAYQIPPKGLFPDQIVFLFHISRKVENLFYVGRRKLHGFHFFGKVEVDVSG